MAIKELNGNLRSFMLRVPEEIAAADGIVIMGRRIKSLVFTTDICVIRNVNADAILAVYPFTPQPIIHEAVMFAAEVPVIAGVGGGLTKGRRVVELAKSAEFRGAAGVVVNAPTSHEVVRQVVETIDIPVFVTVINDKDDIKARLDAGAAAFNVSAAAKTAQIVAKIREISNDVPIIATGGPTGKTVTETILAGANAITWTPPSNGEVFKDIMTAYREGKPHP
ncbi:MAG: hydrolase [Oscillospiraceae bacterium]|jgi:imidazole glycerol phosphate synthase subunit HisF|nr:hydrolase [Oscillospiraceae bacterium]